MSSKPLTIGVVGNGVVGSALAVTYKSKGHNIRVNDIDEAKSSHSLGAVLQSDLVMVCLPTPSNPDGSCNTSILDKFFNKLADYHSPRQWRHVPLVLRSTVPIGYTERIAKKEGFTKLVHSPEFLTARTNLQDAMSPRVNIVGFTPLCLQHPVEDFLYQDFPDTPRLLMTSNDSEAVKLVMNSFFAVKVAFFNEAYDVVTQHGANWQKVINGILMEGRVESLHTQVPGPDGKRGFGGACLPKDLSSFSKHGIDTVVAQAALLRNHQDRRK